MQCKVNILQNRYNVMKSCFQTIRNNKHEAWISVVQSNLFTDISSYIKMSMFFEERLLHLFCFWIKKLYMMH